MSKRKNVGFLLDETGSMYAARRGTIDGFNDFVDGLRDVKKVRFTFFKFNSDGITEVHVGEKLKNVPALTEDTYEPANLTPLYDAIGTLIKSMEGKKGDKLIVIQTDGAENMSTDYSQKDIYDLIAEKKAEGWEFVFLGADIDAYAASASIGIAAANTMGYAYVDSQSALRDLGTHTAAYLVQDGTTTEGFFTGDVKTTSKS